MMKTWGIMIICCLVGIWGLSAYAEEELPLATGEWPPYTSQQMENYGVCTEIVSAIVQEMGMKPKYMFFPWKRAEIVTRNGEVMGTFPYAVTEERKQQFDFSDLIMENHTVLFYSKKHMPQKPEWNTLEDLKPYRIGGVIGYSYVSTLEDAMLNVEFVPLDEQNIKRLYYNRVDLVVVDELVGWGLIKELYPDEVDQFGVLDKAFDTGNSHLMVSRNYPNAGQLLEQFNQALQRIQKNGKYQEILKKYGLRTP